MFPGALAYLEKNGLGLENPESIDFVKANNLVDEHRKQFFKEPIGAHAWKYSSARDGMFTSMRNNELAESFHFQSCLKCGLNGYWPENFKSEEKMNDAEKAMYAEVLKRKPGVVKLKLKNENGGYYFLCASCVV